MLSVLMLGHVLTSKGLRTALERSQQNALLFLVDLLGRQTCLGKLLGDVPSHELNLFLSLTLISYFSFFPSTLFYFFNLAISICAYQSLSFKRLFIYLVCVHTCTYKGQSGVSDLLDLKLTEWVLGCKSHALKEQ